MEMNWFGFELSAFLAVFVVLNIVNVLIQTIKSVVTIKGGKWSAAITNAVAYGLYTVVVVFMNAEGLGILWKAVIIGVANLLGVYVVKLFEEKGRKDKLWLVKITINKHFANEAKILLKENNIPFTFYDVEKYYVFDCYCNTQKETEVVTAICENFEGKMFATENKLNL